MKESDLEKMNHWNGFDLDMGRRVHPIAKVALDLLHSHPNVAAVEDGEDSSGRSKLRLQKAKEIVDRSFEIAEMWYFKMQKMSPEPSPNPAECAIQIGLTERIKSKIHFAKEEKEKV